MNFGAIVMAAGLGTRMKSDMPKVLHSLLGKPMLIHILELLDDLKINKVAIVVSHHKDKVIKAVCENFPGSKTFVFVDQKKPLGTAHAVLSTQKVFKGFKYPVLILSGDAPALEQSTVKGIIKAHFNKKVDLTFATALLDPKTPYGRIIRQNGKVKEVVEALDCTEKQLKIKEMNLGLYCAHPKILFETLRKVKNNNTKQEYYLTDIIKLNKTKEAFLMRDPNETLGINNRVELARQQKLMKEKINQKWMLAGVTMQDPQTTYIEKSVKLSKDVILEPGVHLKGKTIVGSGTVVRAGTYIEDARIDSNCTLGPYARIRPGSHLKKGARVGNFVELKNTILGEGSKANHLTYLGDAVIGKNVNIGCGVITCNYDGGLRYEGKAKTIIGDNSFIGSDVQLIAPVTLKKGAFVASGSSVVSDVPEDSLAIARAKQITKKGYMKKLWQRAKKRSIKGKRKK